MNGLSEIEGEAWMVSRSYDFPPNRVWRDANGDTHFGREASVEIPEHWHIASFSATVQTEAETLLHLADRIVCWLGEQEVAVWFGHGVGNRNEDDHLLNTILTARGVVGHVPDYRFYLADLQNTQDRSAIERILLLMSALNWEGFVLSGNATSMIWMGDEIIKLATNDHQAFGHAEAIGVDLQLQALRPDFYWWSPGGQSS